VLPTGEVISDLGRLARRHGAQGRGDVPCTMHCPGCRPEVMARLLTGEHRDGPG
jgi:hypothetical protein